MNSDMQYWRGAISDVAWYARPLTAGEVAEHFDAANLLRNGSFEVSGIRIANSSQESLSYELKGPYSGWGGPYTLAPGEFHKFEVPYAVGYRQAKPQGFTRYTLPAGSSSEYRALELGGPAGLYQARAQLPDVDASEVTPPE